MGLFVGFGARTMTTKVLVLGRGFGDVIKMEKCIITLMCIVKSFNLYSHVHSFIALNNTRIKLFDNYG